MKKIEVILLAVLSSMLTLSVTILTIQITIIAPFKKEAVDKGYATWAVTDNATGQTRFTWNDPSVPTDTLDQIEDIDLAQAE